MYKENYIYSTISHVFINFYDQYWCEICPEGSICVGQKWLWKFVPGVLK